MPPGGALPSSAGTLLLVASILRTLSHSGPAGLSSTPFHLSDDIILAVLRRRALPTRLKVDFFEWALSRPDFRPSSESLSLALRSVFLSASPALLDIALPPILRSIRRRGLALDPAAFRLLIDVTLRSGRFDHALDVLDDLERSGGAPDSGIYSSVLVALARKDEIVLALSFFDKIVASGVTLPDNVACNQLLVSLRNAKMKAEFRRVFSELNDRCFAFDTWGFNICIHAFGCWGELGIAMKLFKRMKEEGQAPDLCTYNSLIRIFCLVGRLDDALILFEELKKSSGLEPD